MNSIPPGPQLRELLTTFRLQLTEPGLRPALEASCREYSAHFGFTVRLDYQLPPRFVPSHQAIHLLQIAREALSNALKHANATDVQRYRGVAGQSGPADGGR